MENNPNAQNKQSLIRDRAAFIRSDNASFFDSYAPTQPKAPLIKGLRSFKFQLVLAAFSCLVLGIGLFASWQTILTNRSANSTVSGLSKTTKSLSATADSTTTSNVPSTTPPTQRSIDSYVVAADMARFIKILKLNVYARVMQVGVDSDGSVAAPNNIYDTAWYTGSAKPGQSGATLIDGHTSSWTSHGVFYDLKNLVAGDEIQIVMGDGKVLTYVVVTKQVYPAEKVDMKAALSPVTAGRSGLNLITCAGTVKPGTSEFTNRLVIFASLK